MGGVPLKGLPIQPLKPPGGWPEECSLGVALPENLREFYPLWKSLGVRERVEESHVRALLRDLQRRTPDRLGPTKLSWVVSLLDLVAKPSGNDLTHGIILSNITLNIVVAVERLCPSNEYYK